MKQDDIIAVWSAENGDELTRVKGGHGSAVNALAQVGSNVWSGGGDGSICMWAATRRRKMRARHHGTLCGVCLMVDVCCSLLLVLFSGCK